MGDKRKLDARLLWGITLAGFLFIAYFRLTPFDLTGGAGLGEIVARLTWQPLSIKDVPINLLIVIPFSFGLAGLLRRVGHSWSRVMGLTVGSIVALSTTIELVQVYIPERIPSLADIATNALGAVVGVLLLRLAVFGVRRAIVRYASPVTVAAGLAIYAGFVALFTTYLLWSAGLSNWGDDFPLNLGNEATDFRPWQGDIAGVALLDRAVSATEAAGLLAGSLPEDTLAYYDLGGAAPLADQFDALPALVWQPQAPTAPAGAHGVSVSEANWLTTRGAVTPFSAQVRDAGEGLTIAGEFLAGAERQRGPARIISVSGDTTHRNVTLGQQRDALTIRLRTPYSGPNGEKPEMIIPGFFAPLRWQRVVLTYDPPMLRVHTAEDDSPYGVSLAPGLALFQDFESGAIWRLPFPANPHLYDYRYWSLVVIPALLAAAILIGIRDAAIGRLTVPSPSAPRD